MMCPSTFLLELGLSSGSSLTIIIECKFLEREDQHIYEIVDSSALFPNGSPIFYGRKFHLPEVKPFRSIWLSLYSDGLEKFEYTILDVSDL